jgi:tRNA-2-methylthio-N6-dimethylallyladenosine synthase/ribosomal protein S12 methylthiotransferase
LTVNVYAVSLGCPKNRVDTERLLAAISARPVDSPLEADLVLINTCAFIEPAVQESIDTVIDAAHEVSGSDKRPLLAVAGCLPQRYGSELADEIEEVDHWLPFSEREGWAERILNALGREKQAAQGARLLSTGPSYAYLKIHEGCSRGCSFCTIPSIRGPERSRRPAELEAEARELTADGVRELVVVAQDTTAYGRDLGEKNALPRLLERLAGIGELERLRLMYLYPRGLTGELLDFLSGLGEPLIPYFDVPLQHAHPEVLKSMGRPFSASPAEVVDRIRNRFPDAALRTSLIVGFPGETPRHFDELFEFVRKTRFDHLGVFAFCPEEGTRAAGLPGRVDPEEAKRRRELIMQLQAQISAEKLEDRVGDVEPVLVDSVHGEWPGLHVGRCWFQAPDIDGVTYVSGPDVAPGEIVQAEIVESKTYDLVALA